MPRKVLQKAHELGVHNDCLVSENLCPLCRDNVTAAFDFFYGSYSCAEDVLAAIIRDFIADETS